VAGAIVSCNVTSLFDERGARIAAIDSLFAKNPQTLALALQETRCGAERAPVLRDNLIYLCPSISQVNVIRQGSAPPGERLTSGLAIVARRDCSPSIVQDATNGHILTISLEISARDEKLRLFLCNTYINPHHDAKKCVTRQVRATIRKLLEVHPNSPVYVTGDFNMTREEMEVHFVAPLNASKPRSTMTLTLLPKRMFDDGIIYSRKRIQTRKSAKSHGRDIDHVIAVSPSPRSASMAVVHLTLSTQFESDHHPIVFPAVVYPRSHAPEAALAASLSPKVPDAYKEGKPWAPIEAVTGSRPFRRIPQHNAASLNNKEQWRAVRERLTQATSNEAGCRNEAYIAAKELIHANMRALFVARLWRPPRQRLTTPPCDTIEDELLALASSLSTSVMSRYHNTRKVKLALKVDNALQRLCCRVDAHLHTNTKSSLNGASATTEAWHTYYATCHAPISARCSTKRSRDAPHTSCARYQT
jgi:exonuclease III